MSERVCRCVGALVCVAVLVGLAGCGRSRSGGQSTVVIGRGRTAAGEAFVATAYRGERSLPAAFRWHRVEGVRWHSSGCSASVQIGPPGERSSDGGGSTVCLDHLRSAAEPSVNCGGGLLTVMSYTAQRTRRVRLALSNGSSLTSAALIVPARIASAPGIY